MANKGAAAVPSAQRSETRCGKRAGGGRLSLAWVLISALFWCCKCD